MGRINTVRVVIGGLVAGIVANAIDFVINTYLMANEGVEMVQRLNLKADVVEHSMWTWIGFDFVYCLLVVFTYAAMRPRFGPGPKTALIAGMCYWLAFGAMSAGFTAMGMFTHLAFIKSAAFSLASTLVPALVGAAIYKEEE
jgi:hypothetical protein